jgi:hypothetical protein
VDAVDGGEKGGVADFVERLAAGRRERLYTAVFAVGDEYLILFLLFFSNFILLFLIINY